MLNQQATATLSGMMEEITIIGLDWCLKGKDGPAAAISAKVVIQSDKTAVMVNQFATVTFSNSDPRLHIGLGEQKQVDQNPKYFGVKTGN